MSRTAYAVMVIDKKTRQVKGVRVFSEPDPGLGGMGMFTIVILEREADDYGAARDVALLSLKMDPFYAWLKPVVEWERGKLGRPGETVEIEQRLDALEKRVSVLEEGHGIESPKETT